MRGNHSAVLGREQPDPADPPAVHNRALAGSLPSAPQQLRGATEASARTRFFQLFQEAAIELTLPKKATEEQLAAIRELSLLADRVSQLPVADEERNAVKRRLCGCIQQAVRLLDGNQEAAVRWMKTPNHSLNGEVPLELALRSDEGAHEVEQLSGAFSMGSSHERGASPRVEDRQGIHLRAGRPLRSPPS